MSWMKNLCCLLIIIIFFVQSTCGQGRKFPNPMRRRTTTYSNRIQIQDMIGTCQPNSDEYCYLTEALDFILFGEYKNDTDLDKFLEILFHNGTLHSLLQFGLEQLDLFIQDNPTIKPGKIKRGKKIYQIKEHFCLIQVILISFIRISIV